MRFLLCLTALLFAASGAIAQPDWRAVPDARYVSIDALTASASFPFDETGSGESVSTVEQVYALALVSGRVPLSSGLSLTAALPFGFYDLNEDTPSDVSFDTDPAFGIGNVYLGAIAPLAPEASVEVGLWLPTSTDDSFLDNQDDYNFAVGNAGIATYRDYRETFEKDAISARVALRGVLDVTPTVRFRTVISPVASYYSGRLRPGNEEDPRTNLAATGGAFLDGRLGMVSLTAGASGRYEPPGGSIGSFDDLQGTAIGALALEGLPLRPGLTVQAPVLGTTAKLADVVFGFSLDLPLR